MTCNKIEIDRKMYQLLPIESEEQGKKGKTGYEKPQPGESFWFDDIVNGINKMDWYGYTQDCSLFERANCYTDA